MTNFTRKLLVTSRLWILRQTALCPCVPVIMSILKTNIQKTRRKTRRKRKGGEEEFLTRL